MKNIFLLKTDRPSNLVIDTIEDKLYYQPILHKKTVNVLTQFVYITNDEDIKEGDWFIHYSHGTTSLLKAIEVENRILDNQGTSCNIDYCKKVVLTNDPSLIADGVQQVNSSFLSFYAENTPDYVRVEKWLDDEGKRFYSLDFSPKSKLDITKVSQLNEDGTETDITDNPELWHLGNNEEWLSPMQKFSKKEEKTIFENKKWYSENGTVYNEEMEDVKIALLFNNGSYMNLPTEIANKISQYLNNYGE